MLKKKSLVPLALSALSLLLFFCLIVLLGCVDVRAIGPLDSSVGLASLNGAVRDLIGVSPLWYDISEVSGLISLAVAAGFACLGLYRLIRTRSLKRVGSDIYLLGGLYVVVMAAYVFFELFVINSRPVLQENSALEASFPSSHTVLALTVLLSAADWFFRSLKQCYLRYASAIGCCFLALLTVVGRFLSGVHWFTDILGGVLLSASLLLLYFALSRQFDKNSDFAEVSSDV